MKETFNQMIMEMVGKAVRNKGSKKRIRRIGIGAVELAMPCSMQIILEGRHCRIEMSGELQAIDALEALSEISHAKLGRDGRSLAGFAEEMTLTIARPVVRRCVIDHTQVPALWPVARKDRSR